MRSKPELRWLTYAYAYVNRSVLTFGSQHDEEQGTWEVLIDVVQGTLRWPTASSPIYSQTLCYSALTTFCLSIVLEGMDTVCWDCGPRVTEIPLSYIFLENG